VIATMLMAFASMFLFVLLRSFQQLNVVRGEYAWVLPTSLCIANCEVYVMWRAASSGWGWVVIPLGLGAGLGSMAGMWLHSHLHVFKRLLPGKGVAEPS